MKKSSILLLLPWTLSALVSAVAISVWGQSFDWQFGAINAYQFFPVLGLLAFSLMWSQHMVTAFETRLLHGLDLTSYFRSTGYFVLLCIVLHPGILIYSRFRDGYGLPPGSYESFVAPGMAWITLLGTVSLLIFLAYELHRWFNEKHWWPYVVAAGDAALLAIFYHGLRLGSQLQGGWYRAVWWFYGVTLGLVLVRKYVRLFSAKRSTHNQTNRAPINNGTNRLSKP